MWWGNNPAREARQEAYVVIPLKAQRIVFGNAKGIITWRAKCAGKHVISPLWNTKERL